MVIGKPLFSEEQIKTRIKTLGNEISHYYKGKEIIAIGILKGAFMFFSDLVRHIEVPMIIDFLVASSYVKTESSGNVEIHADIREEIKDKHVLLIEDIVDTGLTIDYIRNLLLKRNPASLKICTFLDKRPRRKVHVPLDFVGFEIPDEYVVGYGLDYDNRFRNLPYIAIFKKEE